MIDEKDILDADERPPPIRLDIPRSVWDCLCRISEQTERTIPEIVKDMVYRRMSELDLMITKNQGRGLEMRAKRVDRNRDPESQ